MYMCQKVRMIACLLSLLALTFTGLATRAQATSHIVDVVVPELSETAIAGQAAFGSYCGTCHGAAAGGTADGPPLVHPLYNPNHHSDNAFIRAARQGSQAHHWNFGDMKPVPDVTDEELGALIQYVRELQRANGIE